MRRLVLVALMCLVLGALGGVLAATATRPEPAAARFVPPREPAYDFSLRNQDGKRTSLADARGKVIALTFIYATCRDLCPAEGSDIATAMRMVGSKQVEAYIVSVDPIGDTRAHAEWLNRRAFPNGAGVPDRHPRRTAPGLDSLRDRAVPGLAQEAEAPRPVRTLLRRKPGYNKPRHGRFNYQTSPSPRPPRRRRRRVSGPCRPR